MLVHKGANRSWVAACRSNELPGVPDSSRQSFASAISRLIHAPEKRVAVEKLLQAGTLKQVLKTGIGAQIVCAYVELECPGKIQ